jgi:hypothetical protein
MARTVAYLLSAVQLACLLVIVYAAYLAIESKPVFAIVVASVVLAASLYIESRLPYEEGP